MRIAVLYICTGNYSVFWKSFFESCEKFFLPGHERHYFVFTDGKIASPGAEDRVHRVEQSWLGWPYDTLMRFHFFSKIKAQLEAFDYIFFFNANSFFIDEITEDILPSASEGIVVVRHPGHYKQDNKSFPYDRNKKSTAYIPWNEGKDYICGGINGGHAKDYLKMVEELRNAIDRDTQRGVIARWHDESHLNHYIVHRRYKILSPGYCSPEECYLPFKEKIIILNKRHFGGHSALRKDKKVTLSMRLQQSVRHLLLYLKYTKLFSCDMIQRFLQQLFSKSSLGCPRIHFTCDNKKRIHGFLKLPLQWGPEVRPSKLLKSMMLEGVPPGTVKDIYACHVFEYGDLDLITSGLNAWRKLLRHDGNLRIVAWDRETLEALQQKEGNSSDFEALRAWLDNKYGAIVPQCGSIKTFFTSEQLTQIVKNAGFCDVEKCAPEPHISSTVPFSSTSYSVNDNSLLRTPDRKFLSFVITAKNCAEPCI